MIFHTNTAFGFSIKSADSLRRCPVRVPLSLWLAHGFKPWPGLYAGIPIQPGLYYGRDICPVVVDIDSDSPAKGSKAQKVQGHCVVIQQQKYDARPIRVL